jgi:hypothetical protein
MSRIARLEKYKGFPIPFIVYRDYNGTPHFKINCEFKVKTCIAAKVCSICGDFLKDDMWFIGGPQSAFHPNGAYIDLPVHKECGIYALQHCPYMAYTKYISKTPLGEIESSIEGLKLYNPTMDSNRLKYFVFIKTANYKVTELDVYRRFIYPEKPYIEIEYWADGKKIDKKEVKRLDSI